MLFRREAVGNYDEYTHLNGSPITLQMGERYRKERETACLLQLILKL